MPRVWMVPRCQMNWCPRTCVKLESEAGWSVMKLHDNGASAVDSLAPKKTYKNHSHIRLFALKRSLIMRCLCRTPHASLPPRHVLLPKRVWVVWWAKTPMGLAFGVAVQHVIVAPVRFAYLLELGRLVAIWLWSGAGHWWGSSCGSNSVPTSQKPFIAWPGLVQ